MAKAKRVNLKKILADSDLRRKLMVSTIQATQAREGIEITEEQADRAYYIVSEGEKTAFFDLAPFRGGRKDETDRREEMFAKAASVKSENIRFDVSRRDFSSIEGSPLAYRRVGLVSHIFKECSSLDPLWAVAVQGLATAADPQFVRNWWEVKEGEIGKTKPWIPFAKGGEFCRFYADVFLVVEWTDISINRMKEIGRVQNVEHYFKPGLTWPRAGGNFNVRWLPKDCIFADKGPAIFSKSEEAEEFLCGVLNSAIAEYIIKGFISRESMGARWEVGIIKKLPIPQPSESERDNIGSIAQTIYAKKILWDKGNESCTKFQNPWILRENIVDLSINIVSRLGQLANYEESEESQIKKLFAELNNEVYKLYGMPHSTRTIIEETLGNRPPEILWHQMEGKTAEQKRMEHVWRLISYMVKRIVESDADGIILLTGINGEPALIDRVRNEILELFPNHDPNQIEVEIINELKTKVKGYRRVNDIAQWLEDVFFSCHSALYKKRPIFWHIASSQGRGTPAFSVLVHYHRFDKDRMAILRGRYLKDAIQMFRREAGLAAQEERTEDRQEWQVRLEEAELLDQKLQWIQEGHCEGTDGGKKDFRILTPWKSPEERPKGWEPDLGDGVAVNITPLQKAGVLRIAKVV